MISDLDRPRTGAMADVRTSNPRWKRAMDLAFCAMTLPLLALLALFMATMIKFGSPGPVLFRQERVGHRGKRFICYKFRTMQVGADSALHQTHFVQLIQSNGPMDKLDGRGDPRLIPGGRLIRATGLDELPQIINVMRGEMSLIGPRPCVPYEYDRHLPWQQARYNAVPGLSGLWQVSGKNRTTFEEMIHLDLHYAKTVSLMLDLKIVLMTIPALLQQLQDVRQARAQPAGERQPDSPVTTNQVT